jgi:hypothetical protein
MGIATPGGLWFSWLGGATGLYSPLSQTVIAGEHGSASPEGQSFLLLHGIIQSVIALPWLACHFLMPAYAADSIAPDREQRRIPELILAGLTPRQILVAKGLSAVLPFLVAAAAALVASFATYQLEWVPDPSGHHRLLDPMSAYLGISQSGMLLSRSGVAAMELLLSAAILVCISALSRRTTRAMLLSFGFSCLLMPTLHIVSDIGWIVAQISTAWAPQSTWAKVSMLFGPQFTVLLLQAVALLVLWPRALRDLAYPDEAAG